MAFDFPASPTVGQKYPEPAVTGLPQYEWDGQKWVTLASGGGGGGGGGSGTPSDAPPLMDSVAAPGVATPYSRGDHVHPSDTSKASTTDLNNKVSKLAPGDTMAGNLAIIKDDPTFTLSKTASGQEASLVGMVAGIRRWILGMANGAPESTGDLGSDFALVRFNDAGTYLGSPLNISRKTGIVALEQSPTAPTPTAGDISTKLATTAFVAAADASKVSKIGDVMTGSLTVRGAPGVALMMDSTTAGSIYADMYFARNSIPRWLLRQAEDASLNNLQLYRMDDAGSVLGVALQIGRTDGVFLFEKSPLAPTPVVGDNSTRLATTQFVKANAAPFDALASGGMQINGDFSVNQLGAVFTSANGYFCDGWSVSAVGPVVSAQAAIVAGYGPYRSLGIVGVATPDAAMTGTSYVAITQQIEGWRVARLLWGVAPLPITVSFWCQHTRAGTYSGTIRNAAATRSYAFTYTQNNSDTPEYKTIAIPAPPVDSAVWEATTNAGLMLTFAMASGPTYTAPSANTWLAGNYVAAPGQVNGAQATSDHLRFSGVSVLPGTHANTAAQASLLMRPYGEELALCMRYYEIVTNATIQSSAIGTFAIPYAFKVKKRVTPTMLTTVAPSLGSANNPTFNGVSIEQVGLSLGATATNGYATGWGFSADARL